MFGAALLKTFPSLDEPGLRKNLQNNCPVLSLVEATVHALDPPSDDELLSSMLLVNLFEVKALVLGLLTKPVVIAHAPEENRRSLQKIFDVIIEDEARHIKYSADYIEAACLRGETDIIRCALHDFQATLNQVTMQDLEKDAGAEAPV